ncbi:hypothetical protein COY31_02185, partial [Candidatus Wolfebacteria bacterium CG_4_10_14_0_2_um_filter_39_18]
RRFRKVFASPAPKARAQSILIQINFGGVCLKKSESIMKIAEPRKLFGFIKMDVQNTQTVDASNGNLLNESKPWYYFLTTK